MSDQSTPAVQPEGQGGEDQGSDQGSGLYDLTTAPEEYRPYLEAELKKIEGNATRKFQEHADFRKQWEPYGELGLTDIPTEELQELLKIREFAQDPDTFDSWLRAMAEHRGLKFADAGADDEYGDDEEGETPDLDALVKQQVEEALAPFRQQFSSQQEEQRVTAELETIEAQLASLQEEHGEFDREKVCQLALAYAEDDDAIGKAFADYQSIRGGAERGLVAQKMGQPGGAVEGGQAVSKPDEVNGFEGAKKAAMERMRASRGT